MQATAPQNVRGTVLNYSVEQLLIHLDDQDEALQSAVFAVLKVSGRVVILVLLNRITACFLRGFLPPPPLLIGLLGFFLHLNPFGTRFYFILILVCKIG